MLIKIIFLILLILVSKIWNRFAGTGIFLFQTALFKFRIFENYSAKDFAMYKREVGLAMEVEDLLFIQDYFKSIGQCQLKQSSKS